MVPPAVIVALLALVIATCSSFTLGTNHATVSPGGSRLSTELDSSSSSSLSLPNGTTRQNKFQNGIYKKPIVLIGCRGAGDELMRLANSIIVSTTNGNGKILTNLETLEEMKDTTTLDSSHVLVLDFDAAGYTVEEEATTSELTTDLSDLAKALYEDEGMLVVYVNVHPEEGNMSSTGRGRKEQLEKDVFRKYSDYEICIKNEGLLDNNNNNNDPLPLHPPSWSSIQWHLSRLLARASLPSPTPGSPTPTTNTSSSPTVVPTVSTPAAFAPGKRCGR